MQAPSSPIMYKINTLFVLDKKWSYIFARQEKIRWLNYAFLCTE